MAEVAEPADMDAFSGDVVRVFADGVLDMAGVVGGRAEVGRDWRELQLAL